MLSTCEFYLGRSWPTFSLVSSRTAFLLLLSGSCPGRFFPRIVFQSSTSLLPNSCQLLRLAWREGTARHPNNQPGAPDHSSDEGGSQPAVLKLYSCGMLCLLISFTQKNSIVSTEIENSGGNRGVDHRTGEKGLPPH